MPDRIPVYIDQDTQRITEVAGDDVVSVGLLLADYTNALVMAEATDIVARNTIKADASMTAPLSQSVEQTVFGGINILGADAERPEELPYSPEEKSVQYALTVSHETLGRTVEIDKEGVIKANDFADINGNSLIWKGTQAEYDALTPNENTLYFIV